MLASDTIPNYGKTMGKKDAMNKSVTLSLPLSVLELVERVKKQRKDPTRSDTVRILLLDALAQMRYLSTSQMKALGLKTRGVSKYA